MATSRKTADEKYIDELEGAITDALEFLRSGKIAKAVETLEEFEPDAGEDDGLDDD